MIQRLIDAKFTPKEVTLKSKSLTSCMTASHTTQKDMLLSLSAKKDQASTVSRSPLKPLNTQLTLPTASTQGLKLIPL